MCATTAGGRQHSAARMPRPPPSLWSSGSRVLHNCFVSLARRGDQPPVVGSLGAGRRVSRAASPSGASGNWGRIDQLFAALRGSCWPAGGPVKRPGAKGQWPSQARPLRCLFERVGVKPTDRQCAGLWQRLPPPLALRRRRLGGKTASVRCAAGCLEP